MTWLRPFVPASDFARSIEFYEAIGFAVTYRDETVAIFEQGRAGFLLQNYWIKEWAENAMFQFFVDDLDEWWPRTEGLVERFGIRPPKAPEMQKWGIRVGFLTDPSGVLWHVAEP